LFEIYGRNNCVWCDRAKSLLEHLGHYYEFSNVEENKIAMEDFKRLFPSAKTVPQIMWYNEEGEVDFIGGYEDLVKWLKDNKLYTSNS
jgi:glutaredoxin